MGYIGLKGLFKAASKAAKGGGETYPGDHGSAGTSGGGGSKPRITRIKGGGARKSPAAKRGYSRRRRGEGR